MKIINLKLLNYYNNTAKKFKKFLKIFNLNTTQKMNLGVDKDLVPKMIKLN